jgi:hypothetical protein
VDVSVPWWQQLFAPVIEFLWSLLSRFLQTFGEAVSGQEGTYGWAVVGACAILIAAVLVYLVRTVRLSVLRENRLAVADLAARRERSDQLWQTAQRLAAAGRHAEAVPLVYLAALYALDEHALLHVESSLTNREHARLLSQLNPTLGQSFGHIVEDYDRFRYGHAPVVAESFVDFTARAERVRHAAFASGLTE